MFEELQNKKHLAICKKNKEPTSIAVCTTASGGQYWAGSVASDTHLLDYRAEQVAVMMAAANTDYLVERIEVWQPSSETVSLHMIQFLADHTSRNDTLIAYTVYGPEGEVIFQTDRVSTATDYHSEGVTLEKINTSAMTPAYTDEHMCQEIDPETLRQYAAQAIIRNYPTSNSASGYGTAIRLSNGRIYFGGQYSCYDHRSMFHSEAATVINALMSEGQDITVTDLCVVSTKYPDSPTMPCGPCRQFLSEMCTRYGWNPNIHCAASETDEIETFIIVQLLPDSWTSGNI